MNVNERDKRNKRNAAALLLPLAACALFMQTEAHAGTITIAGFSPKHAARVLMKSEQIMFWHNPDTVKSVEATCNGNDMKVSQTTPLYLLNQELIQECPNPGLSVTLTAAPGRNLFERTR